MSNWPGQKQKQGGDDWPGTPVATDLDDWPGTPVNQEPQKPKREVGGVEATGRSLMRTYADTANLLAMAGGGGVVLLEKLANALTGKDGTGMSDKYFANVVDPVRSAREHWAIDPQTEQLTTGGTVGDVAGALAGMLQQAVALGPAAATTFVPTAGARGAMNVAASKAGNAMVKALPQKVQGFAPQLVQGATVAQPTFAQPMALARTQELLDGGVDEATAYKAGLTNLIGNTAMAAVPIAATGNLLKRVATGIPLAAGTGAAMRGAEGAVLGDDYQQFQQPTFGEKEVGMDAGIGAIMAALFGRRGAAAGAAGRAPVPTESVDDAVARVMAEQTLRPDTPLADVIARAVGLPDSAARAADADMQMRGGKQDGKRPLTKQEQDRKDAAIAFGDPTQPVIRRADVVPDEAGRQVIPLEENPEFVRGKAGTAHTADTLTAAERRADTLDDAQVGLIAEKTGLSPDEIRGLSPETQQRLFAKQAATQRDTVLTTSFEGSPDGPATPATRPNVPGDRMGERHAFPDAEGRPMFMEGAQEVQGARAEGTDRPQVDPKADAQREALKVKLDAARQQLDALEDSPLIRDAERRMAAGDKLDDQSMKAYEAAIQQRDKLRASVHDMENRIYDLEQRANAGTRQYSGTSDRPFVDFERGPDGLPRNEADRQAEMSARQKAQQEAQRQHDELMREWKAREDARKEREARRERQQTEEDARRSRAYERYSKGQQKAQQDKTGRKQADYTGTAAEFNAAEGLWPTDEFGFVVSTGGGPIHFGHQRDAGWYILRTLNKAPGVRQAFDIANHPGGKGFTVEVRTTNPKPKPDPAPADAGATRTDAPPARLAAPPDANVPKAAAEPDAAPEAAPAAEQAAPGAAVKPEAEAEAEAQPVAPEAKAGADKPAQPEAAPQQTPEQAAAAEMRRIYGDGPVDMHDFTSAAGKALTDASKGAFKGAREWLDNLIENTAPLFRKELVEHGKQPDGQGPRPNPKPLTLTQALARSFPARMVQKTFGSLEGRMRVLAGDELADKFFVNAGKGEARVETFEHAYRHNSLAALNRVQRAIEGAVPDVATEFRRLRDAGMGRVEARNAASAKAAAAMDKVVMALRTQRFDNTPTGKAAREIAAILEDWGNYLIRHGALDEGRTVKNGYLPRMLDTSKIIYGNDGKNLAAFRRDAVEAIRREGIENPEAFVNEWIDNLTSNQFGVRHEGDATDFVLADATGLPNAMKGRTLSKQFELTMQQKGWYINDVPKLLSQYFAATSRKAEFLRIMGKDMEHWAAIKRRMIENGQGAHVREVIHLIKSATGMGGEGHPTSVDGITLAAGARAFTVLSALERVSMSSVNDLIQAAATTSGRPQDIPKLAKEVINVLRNLPDKQEARLFAENLGMAAKVHDDFIAMSRLGMETDGAAQTQTAEFLDSVTGRFMRSVGMTQLQYASRVAATDYGRIIIRDWLQAAVNGTGMRKKNAIFLLKDMGIPEDRIAAVHKLVQRAVDGKVTWNMLNKGGPDAEALATAIRRFAARSVIEVTKAEKPRWAVSSPTGRIVYALQSFAAGYAKNVLHRFHNVALNDKLTAHQRALLLAGPAVGMLGVALLQGVQWELRDLLFGSGMEQPKTPEQKVMRALSASGVFGRGDVLINTFAGTRYGRDLSSIGVGYVGQMGFRSVEALYRYIDPSATALDLMGEKSGRIKPLNSDNNNTAERAVVGSLLHDLFVEPLLHGMVALAAPLKGASVLGTMGAQMTIGSPGVKEEFVSAIAGPKQKPGGESSHRVSGIK